MAWVTLTATDVQNSLSVPEQTAFSSGGNVSAGNLTAIVVNVPNQIRGKCNAYRGNRGNLGPAPQIPDELYQAAISIGRYELLTSLPGTDLAKRREKDYETALKMLDDVADGKLLIVRWMDIAGNTQEPNQVPQNPVAVGGQTYFPPYLPGNPGADYPWGIDGYF